MIILGIARAIVFGVLGVLLIQCIVIFALGAALYNGSVMLQPDLDSAKNEWTETGKKLDINIDISKFELAMFMEPLGLHLMYVGGFASITLILGLVVTFLARPLPTAVYLVLITALFMYMIFDLYSILWSDDAVKEKLEPVLQTSMRDYKGDYSNDTSSVTWNVIMAAFKCCGVNGYKDLENKNREFPYYTQNETVMLRVPRVCCLEVSPNATCGEEELEDPESKMYRKGCLDVVVEEIMDNPYLFAFTIVVLLQMAVLIGLMVFLLICEGVDKIAPI